MKELNVTWGLALKIWWSWTWRAVLIVLPASFLVGFLAGIFLAFAGLDIAEYQVRLQLFGALVGVAGGVFAMKLVLQKQFRNYRLAVVDTREADDAVVDA